MAVLMFVPVGGRPSSLQESPCHRVMNKDCLLLSPMVVESISEVGLKVRREFMQWLTAEGLLEPLDLALLLFCLCAVLCFSKPV